MRCAAAHAAPVAQRRQYARASPRAARELIYAVAARRAAFDGETRRTRHPSPHPQWPTEQLSAARVGRRARQRGARQAGDVVRLHHRGGQDGGAVHRADVGAGGGQRAAAGSAAHHSGRLGGDGARAAAAGAAAQPAGCHAGLAAGRRQRRRAPRRQAPAASRLPWRSASRRCARCARSSAAAPTAAPRAASASRPRRRRSRRASPRWWTSPRRRTTCDSLFVLLRSSARLRRGRGAARGHHARQHHGERAHVPGRSSYGARATRRTWRNHPTTPSSSSRDAGAALRCERCAAARLRARLASRKRQRSALHLGRCCFHRRRRAATAAHHARKAGRRAAAPRRLVRRQSRCRGTRRSASTAVAVVRLLTPRRRPSSCAPQPSPTCLGAYPRVRTRAGAFVLRCALNAAPPGRAQAIPTWRA